jgi:iron(II)-dependent oxidoreductase
LFARGIDPEAPGTPPRDVRDVWPSRAEVQAFAVEADRRVLDCLHHADLDQPGRPLLDRGEAVYAILEHEAMHQETLLYMWHRLPFE